MAVQTYSDEATPHPGLTRLGNLDVICPVRASKVADNIKGPFPPKLRCKVITYRAVGTPRKLCHYIQHRPDFRLAALVSKDEIWLPIKP